MPVCSILSGAAGPPPAEAPAIRCFLVSATMILLSLTRSLLILPHPGAVPAIASHPDSDFTVESAAVAPIPLRIRCVSAEALPRRLSSLKLCGIVG